ncbi:MAG: hypothetical protein ABJB74_18275 [Gemmatimonas sp.]
MKSQCWQKYFALRLHRLLARNVNGFCVPVLRDGAWGIAGTGAGTSAWRA